MASAAQAGGQVISPKGVPSLDDLPLGDRLEVRATFLVHCAPHECVNGSFRVRSGTCN